MNIRLLSLFFLICFNQPLALELNNPVLYDRGVSPRTEEEKQASYISYDVLEEAGVNVYALLSLTNLGGSDIWYNFTSDLDIYSVDVKSKELLNQSSLSPWPYRLKMQGEGISWEVQKGLHGANGIEKSMDQLNLREVDESPYQLDAYNDYLGCLSKTPLRYGNFDDDDLVQLVLFLNNDLVVFSPQQGKTIFSAPLSYKDELPASQLGIAFGEDRDDLIFQYYSAQGSLNPFRAPFAATRSYAKIYLGHFYNKDTFDIIVWRKLYRARLNSDSIKGFEKMADLWIHYQRSDAGEYLPQDTSPETIQQWFTTKNLTWQKGYPSKSECPGQEGQLIPEMHDPLLNDPDVLQ